MTATKPYDPSLLLTDDTLIAGAIEDALNDPSSPLRSAHSFGAQRSIADHRKAGSDSSERLQDQEIRFADADGPASRE